MTTVMWWGNSDGVKGRCDAKCHNATSGPCHCMCGGRYHGASLSAGGLEQRVRTFGDEVVAAAKARAAAEGVTLEASSVADLFGQRSLFDRARVFRHDGRELDCRVRARHRGRA